jgi:hypothetical protein
VYARSQKGLSYFISTCGATEPDPVKYLSKFEDEWSHTACRQLERPKIVHFLYEYLPLIDEHNKQRQNLLALEKRWPTRVFCFRLLTSILGMAVVDFHRCFRCNHIKVEKKNQEEADAIKIAKFTDLMCGNLQYWEYKMHNTVANISEGLTRITNEKTGKKYKEPNEKQQKKGMMTGDPEKLTCYICRRYLDEEGKPYRWSTSFWCKSCKMPLCSESRKLKDGGRMYDCLEEHQTSDDHTFCCSDLHNKGTNVPREKQIQLHSRRNKRTRC